MRDYYVQLDKYIHTRGCATYSFLPLAMSTCGEADSDVHALMEGLVIRRVEEHTPETSSTIEGGRGCNIFVPVLGGNGTKIVAPTGGIFDPPLVKCNEFGASLPTM